MSLGRDARMDRLCDTCNSCGLLLDKCDCHTTKDGARIALKDLKDSHLANIIALIDRRAKEGITVRCGGGGPCAEDMWYDEDILTGKEARDHLGYDKYIKEWKRRLI